MNFFVAELGSKQLGLLHELLPTATRVGLLVNPNVPPTESVARDVMAAAARIGLQVDVVEASNSREIETAFGTLVKNRDDALLVGPDAFLFSRRVQLSTLATRYAIPTLRDELAPVRHSIIASARASSVGGISRPIARAEFPDRSRGRLAR